jgi:hypothetical protein
MGALIRSLEQKVRQEPVLTKPPHQSIPPGVGLVPDDLRITLDHIERSIVTLVALHIALRQSSE